MPLAHAALALALTLSAVAPPPEGIKQADADSGANPLVLTGTSLAIVGVLAAWGYGAWWDTPTVPFHFKDTGFLNQQTYAGGSDKLGHMYVSYLFTVGVTRLYEALGLSHDVAAFVAAGAVMLVGSGIELTDGITDYGFEYGDVLANTMGIALGFAGEVSPFIKSTVGMRLGYVPSHDFLAHDKSFIKFINDYTGMLFYLDIKPKGIMESLGKDPGLSRYVLTGFVWGTDQYSPVRVEDRRRRSFGVHIGLSLSEILRAAYPEDEGVEKFATFFDFYAVPFLSMTVMSDLNNGSWLVNFGVSNRAEVKF